MLMTTKRHMKSQLILTQNSTFPEVLIDGSRESFLGMLDWLSNPADKLPCIPTTRGNFPPIYALARRSPSVDKLIVEVRDETFYFKGPEKPDLGSRTRSSSCWMTAESMWECMSSTTLVIHTCPRTAFH